MNPVMLLLTSSLVIVASGAFAQGQGQADACSNQYAACMERCSSRPQAVQGACTQSCENTTNQCYQGVYGPSPQNDQAAAPVAPPEPDARDARGEAKPGPKRR
jgi:hypothetical protein